jgi:hypothetical protein
VGSLQDGWPAAVFWFMAAASLLALVSHVAALRSPESLQPSSRSAPDIG